MDVDYIFIKLGKIIFFLILMYFRCLIVEFELKVLDKNGG